MAAYSGWGGQADAFLEDLSGRPQWAEVHDDLRELLTDEEYAAARASTLTAFYTPQPVAMAMVRTLSTLGIGASGTSEVLEPGCGTGAIMAAAEAEGVRAHFTGVEVDSLSARLARAIHPDQTVVHAPLEACSVSSGGFDAVIGNVPYSDAITIDLPGGGKAPIHDYFVRVAVDALRPGGYACLLTSRFTLDKASERSRAAIANDAELVCAVRLPSETFRDAGTDVVCDLLILRKRLERVQGADEAWVHTTDLDGARVSAAFSEGGIGRVIGTMEATTGRFGIEPSVTSGLDAEGIGKALDSELSRALRPLAGSLSEAPKTQVRAFCAPAPENSTLYEYVLDDAGNVWYGDEASLSPVTTRIPGDLDRLRDMVALRDVLRETLATEASTADEAACGEAIARLSHAYEAFVADHGRLCDRANVRAWSTCSDHALASLLAMELTNDRGEYVAPGDVLTRRVQGPAAPMPDHLDSPADALSVSLDRTGGVDLSIIARLLDVDEDSALAMLGDLVVRDPDTGTVVPAPEYLSGDVETKLEHVRTLVREQEDGGLAAATSAWGESLGIPAALDANEQGHGVDAAMARLRETGALGELMDPLSGGTAVLLSHHLGISVLSYYARLATALHALREGAAPLGMAGTDRDAALGGLWHTLVDGSFGSSQSMAPGLATLWLVATAAPAKVSDHHVAALASRMLKGKYSNWRDPRPEPRLLEALLPGCGAAEAAAAFDGTRSRSELACDEFSPCLAFGRALRAHPEVIEYLFTLARDSRDLARATPEGLAEFRREREEFISAQRVSHAPEPRDLASLRALEARLEGALPARVDSKDIAATLGAAWIPPIYVVDFCADVLGMPFGNESSAAARGFRVSYSDVQGRWDVTGSSAIVPPDAMRRYGTDEVSVLRVLEAALNSSVVRVTMPSPDDPERRVTDPVATAAAGHARDELRKAWAEWVWQDPERTRQLEDIYNHRMNRIATRAYDGSHLTLPGHNPQITLRAHQLDAVERTLQSPEGTLIAHSVGAGKTFEGIAAAMEAKRLGRCRKPLFAVPNNITEQWAADFLRLYPSAKVLFMTASDTASADAARRFWARVASGDWDAVIVGQSRFSQLQVTPKRRADYLERRIDELTRSIKEARATAGKGDFTVKALEKTRSLVSRRVNDLRSAKPLEGLSFEDLGVDWLFVDEAHNFKNLAIDTALNVAGLVGTASKKCEDLLDKCTYLREQGLGANIVFATGTPVSNTMSELYNLERYLAPGLLEATGCSAFSAWASVYGEVVDSVEIRPEGDGFQIKQRFARFHNLPELMAAFHDFADVLTAEDLDLDVPDVEGVTVAVEPTDSQRALVRELAVRADRIRNGQVRPEQDNMLKITSEGRKLALDPKLLAPDDPDVDPLDDGKVQECANRVHREWALTAEDRGTQLVFCDTSTPASGTWNVYDDLRRRLRALGIPDEQVAAVSDAGNNQLRRQQLFDRVDAGEVRVLIGSTATLGTGVNVQRHLVAIHDLDCPWRPSDLEQRLGRIRRQGNMWDSVRDYRYVTKGTFDAYLYQTVERKQRFISQVFTNRSPVREAADLDEAVLDYGTIKALATGDPTVRRRLEIENRVSQLELLRRAWSSGIERTRQEIRMTLEPTLAAARKTLAACDADADAFALTKGMLDSWQQGNLLATVGGTECTTRKAAGEAILASAQKVGSRIFREYPIGRMGSLEIRVVPAPGGSTAQLALAGNVPWSTGRSVPSAADTALGQLTRLVDGFDERRARAATDVAMARDRLDAATASLAKPWDGEEELAKLKAELERLIAPVEVVDPTQGQAARGPVEGAEADQDVPPIIVDGPLEVDHRDAVPSDGGERQVTVFRLFSNYVRRDVLDVDDEDLWEAMRGQLTRLAGTGRVDGRTVEYVAYLPTPSDREPRWDIYLDGISTLLPVGTTIISRSQGSHLLMKVPDDEADRVIKSCRPLSRRQAI